MQTDSRLQCLCQIGRLAFEMYAICWEIKCQGRCITSISSKVTNDCTTQQSSSCLTLAVYLEDLSSDARFFFWELRRLSYNGRDILYQKGFTNNFLTLLHPSQSIVVWLYCEMYALPFSLVYIYSDTSVTTLEDRFPFVGLMQTWQVRVLVPVLQSISIY